MQHFCSSVSEGKVPVLESEKHCFHSTIDRTRLPNGFTDWSERHCSTGLSED